MKKECIAMLLAGGQGSRLYALTRETAKPALPFGGKYRIIDFALSNCVNSGIDTVGVLTQYRPLELNSYLGNGQAWDLDHSDGGVHVLPPYVSAGDTGSWYSGTANAIYQNIGFIDLYDPEYVLVLSGDHIYKMDYAKMLAYHKQTGADATISVLEVSLEEATRFGIMNVDETEQIYAFEEKPAHPKSTLASMGVYLFSWKKLRKYLIEDEQDPNSDNDFGKNIIPTMLAQGEKLFAYRFQGYWKDVGTIPSLWDANMDLLSPTSGIDIHNSAWPILTHSPVLPAEYISSQAELSHSLVCDGCVVEGNVENSLLFHSATVEPGANIRYSILMPGATVKSGATVEYSIVAENIEVGENAHVGNPPDGSDDWGVAVAAGNVAAGGTVAANTIFSCDAEEGK